LAFKIQTSETEYDFCLGPTLKPLLVKGLFCSIPWIIGYVQFYGSPEGFFKSFIQ